MITKILSPEPHNILVAAEIIKQGGLAAFPTETVYGLGADAMNVEAVKKIFAAKGRPTADPLIVHICETAQIEMVAGKFSAEARRLAEHFWPGPLTLILPKRREVPDLVTSDLDSVAVRIPNNPVALALIRAAQTPIAAPSANRFGHTSPTTAAHVLHDLDGRIDVILDGGPTHIGVESTVLDVSTVPARILRPGGITREMLESVIGPVQMLKQSKKPLPGLPSPGLLEKHYAPRAEMILLRAQNSQHTLAGLAAQYTAAGKTIGVMVVDEEMSALPETGVITFSLGSILDMAGIARKIYAGMRFLDEQHVDLILCRDFGEAGLGLAIRDRLTRAATRVIE